MRDMKLSAAVCHRSSRAAAPWRAWIAAPVLAAGLLGLLSLGCGRRSPKADELKDGQVLTSEDAGLPDAGQGDGNGGPVGGFDLGDPEGNGSQSSCLPFTCEDVHADLAEKFDRLAHRKRAQYTADDGRSSSPEIVLGDDGVGNVAARSAADENLGARLARAFDQGDRSRRILSSREDRSGEAGGAGTDDRNVV